LFLTQFHNIAEIEVEGDLYTQLLGVLKDKISILQTSTLASIFLYMYLMFVPKGKIIGQILFPGIHSTSTIVSDAFYNVQFNDNVSAIKTRNFEYSQRKSIKSTDLCFWDSVSKSVVDICGNYKIIA
jgi:hypothetical protein